MLFNGSKIPTSVLCTIPQGTFKVSLVPIGHVVSEEKSFERNNIKKGIIKKMAVSRKKMEETKIAITNGCNNS